MPDARKWSDRLPEARREKLAARLAALLPPPERRARGAKTPLRAPGREAPPSPESVAHVLRGEEGFAWLDGGGGGHRFYVRPLLRLRVRESRAAVSGPFGTVRLSAGGFHLLEAAWAAWAETAPAVHLVGYLGYELAGELESLPPPPPDDLQLPDLDLALFDSCLSWDGRAWLLESTDAFRGRVGMTEQVLAAEQVLTAAKRATPPGPASSPLCRGLVAVSRPDRRRFEAAVADAVHRIGTGEIFQVNLCRRLEAPLSADLVWPLYLRLRAASPAERGAFFDLGRSRALLSISPELFLAVHDRVAETRPIKGTRPRGVNSRDDAALARELLASAKDRAELTMIVDVARNDLGRVAAAGSVAVAEHGALLTLPTVFHTASTVRGTLRPEATLVDLLRATFPAASISGAPKIQAMHVVARAEERRRGPAMGAFGWLTLAGDAELAVAIRTAAWSKGRVVYHAGCGIVADSEPEAELAESSAKAKAFLAALGAVERA
jgi:para-aminobenzoate synthetase component 1